MVLAFSNYSQWFGRVDLPIIYPLVIPTTSDLPTSDHTRSTDKPKSGASAPHIAVRRKLRTISKAIRDTAIIVC